MNLEATGVPGLRAETKEMIDHVGTAIYTKAIAEGVQRICPDLPTVRQQADLLSEHESSRLGLSELFYVSTDMLDLAKIASLSMPGFQLEPEDLPAQAGFVYFETPLDVWTEDRGELRIIAACWGPVWGADRPGVWITWYTDAATAIKSSRLQGYPSPAGYPYRLLLHDECTAPFSTSILVRDGRTGEDMEWASRLPHSSADWMAVLRTVWLLMGQTISSTSDAHFDRATRRRMARLDVSLSRVRVITLRRPAGEAGAGSSDREFHHRWIVRGHWRQQWLPSRSVHRPTWIAPHIKGPDGAPLLGGEKVYALKR